MIENYVVDTVSFRSYFKDIFEEKDSRVSKRALKIIDRGFNDDPNIRLSIPSIVFVEIFAKTFNNDEFREKFRTQVYETIKNKNIEIKTIDKEVLENIIIIGNEHKLENHDKVILASAMMLKCPIITCDSKIRDYLKENPIVKIVQ